MSLGKIFTPNRGEAVKSGFREVIVLEAKYRGKGYSVIALQLLLQHVIEKMGAEAVHNDFEENRIAAAQAHLSAGFTRYRQENGILEVLITREQYFRLREQ